LLEILKILIQKKIIYLGYYTMDRFDEPVKIPAKTSNNYKQKDVFEMKDKKKTTQKSKKPKVKKLTSGNRKKAITKY